MPPSTSSTLVPASRATERDRHPIASTEWGDAARGDARAVELRCSDGRLLAGRWFEPPCAPPRAVAVIGPATAVPASYYRHFAAWLAARGYAVLTFDYRGIAASKSALRHGEDVRLRDWARLDMAAALHAADRRRRLEATTQGRALGLLWVGHSLGGNAVGLVPDFEKRVDAVLGVAAQVAYLGHWSGLARVQAWLFFHLMLPLAVGLFGRAPGRMLGPRAEDLPAAAALEWAAWGRTPGFLFGDPTLDRERRYHAFTGPAHLWSIADDQLFGPPAAVDALAEQFSAAQVQRHVLTPASLGVKQVQHFGPFRRDLGAKLWPRLLDTLEAAAPMLAPCARDAPAPARV